MNGKIIDFRARPNTSEYMKSDAIGPNPELKWKRWGYQEPPIVTLSEYVDEMDRAGISMGVFTGRQIIRDDVHWGFPNSYIAECCKSFPDRIIGFAGIDMAKGAEGAADLQRVVDEYGFRGVSLDPSLSGVHVDDKRVYPIYEKAEELKLPVVMTMGPFVRQFADPYRLDKVAVDFPRVNFVCSHGPWPQVSEFLALVFRRPNVYLEPSIYWVLPGNDEVFASANGWASDQIVYASAHPFNPLKVVSSFRSRISWSDAAWERVTYGNAARLLRLES